MSIARGHPADKWAALQSRSPVGLPERGGCMPPVRRRRRGYSAGPLPKNEGKASTCGHRRSLLAVPDEGPTPPTWASHGASGHARSEAAPRSGPLEDPPFLARARCVYPPDSISNPLSN